MEDTVSRGDRNELFGLADVDEFLELAVFQKELGQLLPPVGRLHYPMFDGQTAEDADELQGHLWGGGLGQGEQILPLVVCLERGD